MQYDVVFEGGGAKGMVFVGALEEIQDRGHTYGRLLGTSAGAIAATFVAAGYTVAEMRDALSEKDEQGVPVFASFMEQPRPFTPEEIENSSTREMLEQIDLDFLPDFMEEQFDRIILGLMSRDSFAHLFSFIERGGWYSADKFLEWTKDKLNEGNVNGFPRQFGDMTFAELHQATGRELSLVTADTTGKNLLVLNRITAPDCPVVWGVRMSMSLPLVWQEVIWQESWGLYLGQDISGHRLVDGGLLSNFPIELLLSRDPHVTSLMGAKTSDGVLGLLIDESLFVEGAELPDAPETSSIKDLALPSRLKGLIDTATQAHDKMVIDQFEGLVCHLPAKGYETTEFDMTDERRAALVAAGREAMARYFDSTSLESIGVDEMEMQKALAHADDLALSMLTP